MVAISEFMTGLRGICQSLPGAEEYVMHGHAAFRAGKKPFAIVGEGEKEGRESTLAVKVGLFDQPFVLEDPRFLRTPYIGQHGWVSLRLESEWTWEEVRRLLERSYRLVATKRLLKALDELAAR